MEESTNWVVGRHTSSRGVANVGPCICKTCHYGIDKISKVNENLQHLDMDGTKETARYEGTK